MSDNKQSIEVTSRKRARHDESFREAREPCHCKNKCTEKLLDVEKEDIFKNFYNIPTKNEQDVFLQGLIVYKEIKRRRARKDGAQSKTNYFSYNVLVGSDRREVCRDAFFGLHGISSKCVKRIRRLLQGGCILEDQRRQPRSGNALKPSEVMSVIEHISLFPTKQTHCGACEHNYLDAELNVKIMHSLFLEKHPESKVKYEYYNKAFRENFNLSFGRP
ncbi:hypothetical protein ILUMI_22990 [Ignelater luminosus]|uniref:Uncharacterized protein n=1 Tax=Ignelater luminosus TaxID=2038154 RepID=A0A8K0C905_IGNLU|nr:hypothetical protein ILUMI_22990 [Ignelater luminosus]